MGGTSGEMGQIAIENSVEAVRKDWVGGVNYLGSLSQYAFGDNQLGQVVDAGGEFPPLLAVDEEGGRVARLQEHIDVPSAREQGYTSTDDVEKLGAKVGRTMRKMSLNMNLAPVVDVSDQAEWEVIGDRSYSDDAKKVTEFAGAFANGLRSQDVIPVVKHFPGLGSGSGNTDFEEAETPPLSRLKEKDLIPYESLLLEQPVAVMVTNAVVPGLTGRKPASLSSATYKLLRDDYGFGGVIMTDSLSAAAVQDNLDTAGAVVKSIKSGADIAVWDSLSEAQDVRDEVVRAVRSGEISETQINESAARVLELKGIQLCSSE